jgi:hypothetical protein
MGWLIALNVLMYIGAGIVFFSTPQWIIALLLLIVSCLMTLALSGGKFNPFELFD